MRLAVNGTTLNVRRWGADGPAVILLHYFGGSSWAWTEVADLLATTARCIAPDLPGFGDSDAPATGYTVDATADAVAGLLAALRVERYVLVGHSMGGKVAMALAARRTPGVEALVLVAPSPPTPEPIADEARAHQLRSHGDRAAALETVRGVTARPLAAAVGDRVVDDNLRTSALAWRAWLEHGSREDISGRMAQIAVPTLVVAGGADPHLPADVLRREVVERIPGSRLAVVPGSGHLLPLEAPAATADQIRACLSGALRPQA